MSQSSFSLDPPVLPQHSARSPVIILVDHYDSFSHNLKELLYQVAQPALLRLIACDAPDLEATTAAAVARYQRQRPVWVVLSPGPNGPADVPQSLALYRRFYQQCSFLGICLGHQIMGTVAGYTLRPTCRLNHGGTSTICFTPTVLASTQPHLQHQRFATYNSICLGGRAAAESTSLQVIAHDEAGQIAALASPVQWVQGARHPICHLSLQFHPESFLSTAGRALMRGWLNWPIMFSPVAAAEG